MNHGSNGRYPDGTPQQLGRYRMVRPISTGGMARVFEGRRESLAGVAPRVAVKVILPQHAHDENFRDLFVNEARIGSLLSHQNVVQIQDFDCEKGVYYLVMEFVEGVTVRKSIDMCRRHRRSVPIAVISEVGRQVCDGLSYAHSIADADGRALYLVHRDIKPSNLIAGPQGVVKILDFGISKALISREKSGAVRGTWGYMAPEQSEGQEVGGAADTFALAAVLYEMATLGPLFPEKDPATVRSLMASDEAARRASQLGGPHGDLSGILVRALQRDPAARYPSAKAMGKALGSIGTDPVTAREHLLHFQKTIQQLYDTGTVEGAAGAEAEKEAQEDAGGLGIAVGNRARAHQPGAPVPVRRIVTRRKRRLTPEARRIFMVFGLIIAGLAGWWAWEKLTSGPGKGDEEKETEHMPAAEDEVEEETRESSRESSVETQGFTEKEASDVEVETPSEAAAESSPVVAEEPAPSEAAPEESEEEATEAPSETGPAVGNFGTVTIYTTGRGDAIWMDGQLLRKSPLLGQPLSPGTHEFTLKTAGGETYTSTIGLEAGDRIVVQWDSTTGEVRRIER